jgi:hypothetical protein
VEWRSHTSTLRATHSLARNKMAIGGEMGVWCLSRWCRIEFSVRLSASIGTPPRGFAVGGWGVSSGWKERESGASECPDTYANKAHA